MLYYLFDILAQYAIKEVGQCPLCESCQKNDTERIGKKNQILQAQKVSKNPVTQ